MAQFYSPYTEARRPEVPITDEEVARRQRLAELLTSRAGGHRPVYNAAGGIGMLMEGIGAGLAERAARNADAAQHDALVDTVSGLFDGGSASSAPAADPISDSAFAQNSIAAESRPVKSVSVPEGRQGFVDALMPHAVSASRQTGVDPRIIVAQAALESAWGRKAPGNNFFGIKSHGKSGGQTFITHEVIDGKRVKTRDSFRQYGSPAESVQGYADFIINNPRYGEFRQAEGLEAQAAALQASGYATDPEYGRKILSIASGLPMPAVQQTVFAGEQPFPEVQNLGAGQTPVPQPGNPDQVIASRYPDARNMGVRVGPEIQRLGLTPDGIGRVVQAIENGRIGANAFAAKPTTVQPQQIMPFAVDQTPRNTPLSVSHPEEQGTALAQTLLPVSAQPGIGTGPQSQTRRARIAHVLSGRPSTVQQSAPAQRVAQAIQQRSGGVSRELLERLPSSALSRIITNQVNRQLDPRLSGDLERQQLEIDRLRRQSESTRQLKPQEIRQRGLNPRRQWQIDPDGTLSPITQDTRPPAERGYRYTDDGTLEPIPGGSAATERAAEEEKAAARAEREGDLASIALDDTKIAIDMVTSDEAWSDMWPKTGFMGWAASYLRGSPAYDLWSRVQGLKSYISRDALQQMRENSPTGGALGNVSNRDISILEDAYGQINTASSREEFLYTVNRFRNLLLDKVHGEGSGPDRREFDRDAGVFTDELRQQQTKPADIEPELWELMTPEERALWNSQ